jgi:hypothetical protein
MVFGKEFRSKMEKMFSSSGQDEVHDAPPPYTLPDEFHEAGIMEDDMAILKDYDTVIIVDDSGSMDPLWKQACRALQELAVIASKYDSNGIDIHFLNHPKAGERLKAEQDVLELFNEVSPCGPTPLGDCLERVTHKLLKNLDKGKSHKKTNYLVITDGRASELSWPVDAE